MEQQPQTESLQTLDQVKELAHFQQRLLLNIETETVKNQLTNLETQLATAATCQPIIGFIKKKQGVREAFTDVVLQVCALAGIKVLPDKIIDEALYNYVLSDLDNYTFADIILAAKMNAAGQLAERVEHYQLCDINFISKLMYHYFAARHAMRQRVRSLLPVATVERQQTPQESHDGLLAYIAKNKEFPITWSWALAYQFMKSEGIFKFTNDEDWKLYRNIEAAMRAQLETELMSAADIIERDRLQENFKDRVLTECRKIRILEHYSYLIPAKK